MMHLCCAKGATSPGQSHERIASPEGTGEEPYALAADQRFIERSVSAGTARILQAYRLLNIFCNA